MAWQQIEVTAKKCIRKEVHNKKSARTKKRQKEFIKPQKQKSHTKLAWLFNCIF